MLSEELLNKIQGFHFKTRHLADDVFAGQYESAFKGRGLAFSEVREYQPGDDVRTIDWNVSARFGHPFVKVFHEERELTVMFLLDLSGSHLFGTRRKFKREVMAEAAGMLAFLAIRTNDKVGAILFSSRVERCIPPKKGAGHVWRLIKEIFTYSPDDLGTDIKGALEYLNRVVRRHAVVFVISDCMDEGFATPLNIAARKHDVTVLRISDPLEEDLPPVGRIHVRDPENGRIFLLNTRDARFREKWRRYRRAQQAAVNDTARRAGVDLVDLRTDGSVSEPLIRLFHQRRKRR